jgi:hypothetical protein
MSKMMLIIMRNFIFISAMATIIAACSVAMKNNQSQGITGKIVWLEGNLMPAIGDTTMAQRMAGRPVQRTIYIYEPTVGDETEKTQDAGMFYSKIHTKLVKKVNTDGKGTFRIVLPPGKYSVFVLEEKGFFANIFDGEGYINPVIVEAGKFTEMVIKVNYMAFY